MPHLLAIGTLGNMEMLVIAILCGLPVSICVIVLVIVRLTKRPSSMGRPPPPLPVQPSQPPPMPGQPPIE